MHRFYVKEEQIKENRIYITGSDVNHIINVLRMSVGEGVVVCNGTGRDYFCLIHEIRKDEVLLYIQNEEASETELPSKIYLFQGIPKSDKMEMIIQKAVELGVYEIIPVKTNRCVVKFSEENRVKKKIDRWNTIAESAAKQSGRGIIPNVKSPISLKEALTIEREISYNIIPYELAEGMEQAREKMKEAADASAIGIFIGPEGGFEEEEIGLAIECGCHPITLGKRILRTETAGIAVLSILMFQMEQK